MRVGCGQYDWHFVREPSLLADLLCITIDEMLVLDSGLAPDILNWASELPYPWCAAEAVLETMPGLEQLVPIRKLVE